MYAARRFVSAGLFPLTDSSSISRASSILAACLIFFCTASKGRISRPLDLISASAPALWARGICTSGNNVTTWKSITDDGSSELRVWRGQLLQIHVQLNTEIHRRYSIDVSVHDLQVILHEKAMYILLYWWYNLDHNTANLLVSTICSRLSGLFL